MDRDRLGRWCADHLDWRDQTLGTITELDSGWESDVFRLELRHVAGTEDLVVRCYHGLPAAATARREFAGLRRLRASGYPVPPAVAVEPSPAPLGRPFLVMEWVPGSARRGWPETLQPDHLGRFVQLLGDLHDLDWRPFADTPDDADAAVAPVRSELASWDTPYVPLGSAFGAIHGWMASAVTGIEPVEPAVLHRDFHVGNILTADSGRATVVDWTQVGVGDPRFDVAWTRLLAAMAVDETAADRFLVEYERRSRPLPDMRFFDVAVAFKRLFSVAASLRHGPEILGMRAEAAARMRADLPTLALPYATVRAETGIVLPEVESLLRDSGA